MQSGFNIRRVLAIGGLVAGLAFALIGAGEAWAGAFNFPEGQGLAIADFTFSGGSRYFNGLGKLASAPSFKRGDASLYLQYGVTDWLMAIVRPDLAAVSLQGHPGQHYDGLGPSEAGAQAQILVFGPAVLAVQGSFRLPGSTDTHNRALLVDTARAVEGRALLGYAFALGDWPAFLDAQAGYRLRDSGAPDEIHADLTLGVRPDPDLLLMAQAFNTTGLGRGTPWFPRERFTHVGLAAVYDLTETWSAELAGYTTILGRRSLREQAVTTAVWYRF